MQVLSVQQLNPVTIQIAIEVDTETVQRAFDRAVRYLGKNVRVPGFRPGQAPLNILKQMLAPDIVRRVASEILVEESLERALQEQSVVPYRPPGIEIEQLQEGEPFRFKATIPLRPVVELGDYESIHIPLPTVEVSDEEVQQVVEALREETLTLERVSDAQAEVEDRLVIQMRPLEPDDARPQRFMVILGRSFAELDNALAGMRENETKQLELTFPENWDDPELAGKTVPVELTLQQIHRPRYKDDSALAQFFQHESPESLRETVRGNILSQKMQQAINDATEQLLQALRERCTVHIPEALVEEETRAEAVQFAERLQANRISVEQFLQQSNMSREQLQEALRQRALARLQNTFILLEIANKEQLEPTREEIEQYLEQFIAENAKTPQERARMRDDQELRYQLTQELRIEKALQKLTANLQNKEAEGATP